MLKGKRVQRNRKKKENFPKLKKDAIIQVQEGQRSPDRVNSTKSTPRHIIIKLSIIKNKKKKDSQSCQSKETTHKFTEL